MLKFFFTLTIGFIVGAIVMENKQHFSDTVAIAVAFLPDGGEYDGGLAKDELSGRGKIVWPDGSIYEGDFKQGLFHGQGRYQTQETVYQGDFVNGIAVGQGVITFVDGARYEGETDFGMANGQGSLVESDQEYIGQFKNNAFDGQGKLIKANGDIYQGDFVAGLFHGSGLYTTADGKVYQGEFVDGELSGAGHYRDGELSYTGEFKAWLYHGEGHYKDATSHYRGSFVEGHFHGVGTFQDDKGTRYQGDFKEGLYHGQGHWVYDGGHTYQGEFEYGLQHGQGELTYAKPLDGRASVKGVWQYGKLVDSNNPLVEHDAARIVEDVLYRQKERVAELIDAIDDNDPSQMELYFVGVAGDGTQGVFRRELNFIRETFDQHYETQNKSALLINSDVTYNRVPLATVSSIRDLLLGVAKKMDADKDILFIYLTSHGSSDFEFQLSQPGLELSDLNHVQMGEIIHSLPVRHKVVVISACYSGGYIPAVKDDHTMVIVAASEDKTSFGCSDTAEMTYFGEAFFKDALLQSASFAETFERARDIVRGREAKEGFEYSNPLIFKPRAIVQHLSQWRQALAERKQQQNRQIAPLGD